MRAQHPRQTSNPSLRVMSRQAQKLPSDIGILPDTFITPTGTNAPQITSTPLSTLLKFKFEHIKTRLRDRFSLFALYISSPRRSNTRNFFKRSIKLGRRQIAPTALALHREMYTSFADGEINTLRRICTDGIFETFRSRVGNRQKDEKVLWELVRYNKSAKLVSHRGATIPIDGMAIRQAVVRISSTQRLTRWVKGKGGELEIVPGSGKEKDVVEYLVLQKMARAWKEGEWQVWGTTTETTLEDVEEREMKKLEE
ncbi:hypothetical protein BKA65DRAFT_403605 [Rhexocercosporidium sp. MPI-PUGE-AT-0058]|nr:hypothetical protein BKA65DRAFT_403605 [Rhexocercosporidium sp. MPI-PUGE-AT-0058]